MLSSSPHKSDNRLYSMIVSVTMLACACAVCVLSVLCAAHVIRRSN